MNFNKPCGRQSHYAWVIKREKKKVYTISPSSYGENLINLFTTTNNEKITT